MEQKLNLQTNCRIKYSENTWCVCILATALLLLTAIMTISAPNLKLFYALVGALGIAFQVIERALDCCTSNQCINKMRQPHNEKLFRMERNDKHSEIHR